MIAQVPAQDRQPLYPEAGGVANGQPMAVAQPVGQPPIAMAQPVGQQPMMPVAMAQPVGQPMMPVAAAQPIGPVGGVTVVQQTAVPGSQLHAPQQMSRDVDAFGFVCKDRDYIHSAKSLAGIYCSMTWWFCPVPCLVCRKFSAPDENTLVLSGCNCGCPNCENETYHRNWDENQQPGPPNSFSSNQETFEFGAHNGLCAGSSSTTCYLRVC